LLPVEGEYTGALADVLSRQKVDRRGGYAVTWANAMRVLGEKHPDAKKWWEQNVGGMMSTLIFTKECGEIVIE
jgi:hypothetical protein